MYQQPSPQRAPPARTTCSIRAADPPYRGADPLRAPPLALSASHFKTRAFPLRYMVLAATTLTSNPQSCPTVNPAAESYPQAPSRSRLQATAMPPRSPTVPESVPEAPSPFPWSMSKWLLPIFKLKPLVDSSLQNSVCRRTRLRVGSSWAKSIPPSRSRRPMHMLTMALLAKSSEA